MTKRRVNADEGGAIIMEATISLTAFMFAMFTLLSIIQMAYAQSRMSVALCCATKEIAEYSHIYFITGMDESFSGKGGLSSDIFGQLGEFLEQVGSELGPLDSGLGEFVTSAGNSLTHTSVSNLVKNFISNGLAYKLMDTNLGDGTPEGAALFKKRYHIENVSMLQSSVFERGNEIYIRVLYDIRVVKLLNLDYVFHMSTWAYSDAWSGR